MIMLTMTFPEKATDENMPSLNHSYICTQVMKQLLQNHEILPLTELTLDIENGLTPDISVYTVEEIKPDFFNDISRYDKMPVLAIEVISSSQNIQDVLIKAVKLVDAGVKSVWTLEPYSRTIFLTNKDVRNKLFHNQSVETEGITVDFRKIFEQN
jgi:Uma2 family endonuclease